MGPSNWVPLRGKMGRLPPGACPLWFRKIVEVKLSKFSCLAALKLGPTS